MEGFWDKAYRSLEEADGMSRGPRNRLRKQAAPLPHSFLLQQGWVGWLSMEISPDRRWEIGLMPAVATAGPGFKETIICDSVLQLKVCWREGGMQVERVVWLAPKKEMHSREKKGFNKGEKRRRGSISSKGPEI